MDISYLAILLFFFVLISALAYGCARLQRRHGGAPIATATARTEQRT